MLPGRRCCPAAADISGGHREVSAEGMGDAVIAAMERRCG